MTETALTTRDMADRLDTDPKTLRVFLRASDDYKSRGIRGALCLWRVPCE